MIAPTTNVTAALRWVNSAKHPTTIRRETLKSYVEMAGEIAGSTESVDLVGLTAWAVCEIDRLSQIESRSYAEHKLQMARRGRELTRAAQEIEIPDCVDAKRKESCRGDFRAFCELYQASSFELSWSRIHLAAIDKIEQSILNGQLYAFAMPRGTGKTTLTEAAILWAVLYGHHKYIAVIGADDSAAAQLLGNVYTAMMHTDLIADDFPEAVTPWHEMDGTRNRVLRYNGRRLELSRKANELIMPPIGDSASVVVHARGITGGIRGMKYKRPDGSDARPSLVVIDDPQTDDSAKSPSQSAERVRILNGAILGLAGPGKSIAGVMPCTVIRPNDMADQILDRSEHPAWRGERYRLVEQFPSRMDLWDQYNRIMVEELEAGTEHEQRARQFVEDHYDELHEGAVVAWEDRYDPAKEVSALHAAMYLRMRDPISFDAEMQNDPMAGAVDRETLDASQVIKKLNRLDRNEVPDGAEFCTAFIDVQQTLLYYCVVAWSPGFRGWVLDYGAFPDQRQEYFELKTARPTMQQIFPRAQFESVVYQSLERLTEELAGRILERPDGDQLELKRIMVDASWGDTTDTIHEVAKAHRDRKITPSHGAYKRAGQARLNSDRARKGERRGLRWSMPAIYGRKRVRHITYDANFWKSFVHERLKGEIGEDASLSLWGTQPRRHRMIAEHCCAETRYRVEAGDQVFFEWRLPPNKPDNHLFDCLVGCAVGASVEGAKLEHFQAKDGATPKRKRKIKFRF